MKIKILWCGLSLLLVAALVLTSCRAPVVEEKEVGPQYGGTIIGFNGWRGGRGEPPSWDTCDGMWFATQWVNPHMETLMSGDIDKYGPRGTGDLDYHVNYVPEQYLRGLLCDSWEVTPDKITFHIRQGVYWAAEGREHIMETREVTADDVAFSLNRFYDSPAGGPGVLPNVESIYAEGDTVIVETSGYNANWPSFLGYSMGSFLQIYPPEVVAAGASEWQNAVGTGPFILTDYVMGSKATWKRNPIYWDSTTINGKEYEIPFIEEFIAPIIPDVAAQIAALRTGKIDYYLRSSPEYVDTLAATSPDLVRVDFASGGVRMFALQTATSKYFTNRDVRRAMMIGTDLEAIRNALYPGGEIYAFPLNAADPAFTPLEELPPEAREVYDYNPEKAKQMLADAGYPDGFEVEAIIEPVAIQQDLGSMIEAQWSKLGVKVNLKTAEAAVHSNLRATHEYKDAITCGQGTTDALKVLFLGGHPDSFANTAAYNDPYFTEQIGKAGAILDLAERNAILKDLAVHLISDVAYIPFAMPTNYSYFWPWLKNHYGEFECGSQSEIPFVARMWIDQDLKKELGH